MKKEIGEKRSIIDNDAIGEQTTTFLPQILFIRGAKPELAKVGISNRLSELMITSPAIQAQAKKPLRDTAAVNATRHAIYDIMAEPGFPLELGTGGQTKHNRIKQGDPKTHWLDGMYVGESGESVYVAPNHQPICIQATGRQSRQMCCVDKFGFPRTTANQGPLPEGFSNRRFGHLPCDQR